MARVLNITRYATHDGPGIRSTVFLKGCPLHCAWCHNPESQRFAPEIAQDPARCISCGACAQVCPQHAVRMTPTRQFDRARCGACGACAEVCPTEALVFYGKERSVVDVFDEVVRDRAFYDASGGGVTVSGGEPLSCADFVAELFARLHSERIHTAVETAGFISDGALRSVLPVTDLFLFDIKETNPARHLDFTGVPLAPILDRLREIDRAGKPILLRAPIVPGYNDRPAHLHALGTLARALENGTGVELMPYHTLGAYKYTQLDRPYPCADVAEPSAETKAQWQAWLDEAR